MIESKLWLAICGNEDFENLPLEKLHRIRICARHFQDWCFLNIASKHRLVHNAVPVLSKDSAIWHLNRLLESLKKEEPRKSDLNKNNKSDVNEDENNISDVNEDENNISDVNEDENNISNVMDGNHSSEVDVGLSLFEDFSKSYSLNKDLERLYRSGKFSDITLLVKHAKFPAHKNILASRSDVFDAMFQSEVKEIQINDIDPATLNSMLQYIYTNNVEDFNVDKAISLYPIANRYWLHELKKWCINIMLENLTADNVCQIAILCDSYPDPMLKKGILNIFCQQTDVILKKKEWKKFAEGFQKSPIMSDILNAISTDLNINNSNSK